MGASLYSEIAPAPELRPYIKCFWHARAADGAAREQMILPDGCADLIFVPRENQAPELRAVGAMTRPMLSRMKPGAAFLGIRFRPGGAYPFFGLPLRELSDQVVPAVELDAGWDRFAMQGPVSARDCMNTVQGELIRRVAALPPVDARIAAATMLVDDFAGDGERVTVAMLSRELNLSRQHLKRLFDKHTGLGPAKFIRIARLQALLAKLERCLESREPDWADLALRFGYYDQAHLINDFRELTGSTPGFHFSNTWAPSSSIIGA